MRLSATLPLSMSRALFRRPEQRFLLEPIRYFCLGWFGALPAAVLPAVVAASARLRVLPFSRGCRSFLFSVRGQRIRGRKTGEPIL